MNYRFVTGLFLVTLVYCLFGGIGQSAHGANDQWVLPQPFRLPVRVDKIDPKQKNCPVGIEIDFASILRESGVKDRLDRYSIRVVAKGKIVPHTTTGDLANNQKGMVWWRVNDPQSRNFHIYFDSIRKNTTPSGIVGLVGIGDTLHYNNGQTAMANTDRLHSQFLHLDWDGDGKRDLIGWGYRYWEHGESLGKQLGNAVYFLKNVGTVAKPLFSPPYRVKGSDGKYLQSDLLPQNMFSSDWDGDGDIDFYGLGRGHQLLLWNNSGRRDANGLWMLDPPRVVMKLDAESEFRRNTPGIIRKRHAWSPRGLRRVDWEGDGDLDLLVGYLKTSRLRVVDASRGVIPCHLYTSNF